MKRLNVTITCSCIYNSGIDVPDNMSLDEAIKYAQDHLMEIPLGTLEYINDSDNLVEDCCNFDVTLTSEKILFIRMGESNMKMLQERGLRHNVPVYIEQEA